MSRTERFQFYRRAGCCGGCLAFLILILLLTGFSSLEYYEMGFKQSIASGTVDRSKTFLSGRHWTGPMNTFVVYPASMVDEYLRGLEAWTQATVNVNAGTSVTIDVGFQYKLIPEELDQLYDKVGVEFKEYIKNIAINTLKNNATRFSSDEFIQQRRNVESAFKQALAGAFREKANAKLINFQLRNIGFPKSFMDRKLAGAIQNLKNDAESYRKQATLTRAETTKLVLLINNEGRRIKEEAKAVATFTEAKARNEADRLTQNSRHEGLKILRDALNITEQKHILSLDYLFGMIGNKADIYVNFDSVDKRID